MRIPGMCEWWQLADKARAGETRRWKELLAHQKTKLPPCPHREWEGDGRELDWANTHNFSFSSGSKKITYEDIATYNGNRSVMKALPISVSICQAGCCNIVKLLGRGRLPLCKEHVLLWGPQSPPPRHAPYVPQAPPEDLDSPLSFRLPGGEWTDTQRPPVRPVSGMCRSGNWPEIWTAGCSCAPAWCPGGPGRPLHTWASGGGRGAGWAPTPSPCASTSVLHCRVVAPAHKCLNVSNTQGREHHESTSKNGILCSIYLLRNWAKFCSEKSERSHTMEPEEMSFAGSLGLGQGLGVQLWQDPLEGELQSAWHTLAITGAAKEAPSWMGCSFMPCKHITKEFTLVFLIKITLIVFSLL